MKKINFTEAFKMQMEKMDQTVFTDYHISQIILGILKSKKIEEKIVDVRAKNISIEFLKSKINQVNGKSIVLDNDFSRNPVSKPKFPRRVWKNVMSIGGGAEQVACIVDPFCYISHLSAMQVYGLTNRNPKDLHLTVAGRETWKELSTAMDRKLRGDRDESSWVRPMQVTIPARLRKRTIRTVTSEHLCRAPILQDDGHSRIVPIGRCFVDMLTNPELCGGMAHCLDVFQEHAQVFMEEIVEAVEAEGQPIIKVRAGYILDEIIGVEPLELKKWATFVQRGGSRKLDPTSPFNGETYSEKWMLSLNV